MAITKCKECNNEISTKAEQCPKCGAKQKRSIFWPLFIGLVVIVSLGLLDTKESQQKAYSTTAAQVQAQAVNSRVYKSESEAVFCTSKVSAKKFQHYMEQKDVAAAASVIQSGGCSVVTPSLELFIDSEDAGVVGVRRKGLTDVVWTFKHMLK